MRLRRGRLQAQPIEKHFGELLRRIDLELEARELVDALFEPRDFFLGLGRNDVELFFVDSDTGAFHASEHRSQRKIDRVVQAGESHLFDFRAQHGREPQQEIRALAGRAGERAIQVP